MTTTISGTIKKIIYKKEETSYHILAVETTAGKEEIVVINQSGLYEGLEYDFTGEHIFHQKFGRQFKCNMIQDVLPTTLEGLLLYLQSGLFPGIGKVMANRIVRKFGEDTMRILNESPDQLLKVQGISKKKLVAIKEAWEKNKYSRELMIFLRGAGVSNLYSNKIYKLYGHESIRQITENPYKLIEDIDGIGFKKADLIANKVGIEKDSRIRVRAGVDYILDAGMGMGHCYLTKKQLCDKTLELLEITNVDKVIEMIVELVTDRIIRLEVLEDGTEAYYNRKIYAAEVKIANRIEALLANSLNSKIINLEWISELAPELSEEQKKAVYGTVTSKVSVLTGAAGTGKTKVVKTIVDIITDRLNKTVMLCSPTGRAAKVMTNSVGMQASTIHRLLKYDPINKGFRFNETMPLETDYIICDETSMVDVELMSNLLKAVDNKSSIIFVGDSFQLPSVGSGECFQDFIESGVVPTFRLTQIFRQAKESSIIMHAAEINEGAIPNIPQPLMDPKVWETSDTLFIESGMNEAQHPKNKYPSSHSLRYGFDTISMLVEIYTKKIPKYFGDKVDTMVIIPANKGTVGTRAINILLQDVLNPHASNKTDIIAGDNLFREGSPVMVLKNNYDLDVYNGDIGKIVSIDKSVRKVIVNFPDGNEGRIVEFMNDDLLQLGLAYVISIHKSQGGQADCVIMLLDYRQHNRLLQRRLIYTGVTRAKKKLIIIGESKALANGINNSKTEIRQTYLKERLLKAVPINM